MASLPKIWSPNKKLAATTGANVVPNELKAWDKFNLTMPIFRTQHTDVGIGCNLQNGDASGHHKQGQQEQRVQPSEAAENSKHPSPAVPSRPECRVGIQPEMRFPPGMDSRKPRTMQFTKPACKSQLNTSLAVESGHLQAPDEPPHEKERGRPQRRHAWISSRSIESWKKLFL